MDAAVDYVLLSELFKDYHAFRNSTYMHEARDGRLALGPLWDFDVSTGNAP